MYHFAVVALLGLATLKVVDLLIDIVPALDRFRSFLLLAIGVVAAVVIDYSVFDGFGIAVRERWLGTGATGLVIGSFATAWRTAFGYLGATGGAGEGEAPSHGRPRMAA
jgi:hypothetical protein